MGKKGRCKEAIIMLLISFGISGIIGLLFGAISTDEGESFIDNWFRASEIIYIWFGGGSTISCILLLVTSIPSELVFGFGHGLYYGAAFGGAIIYKMFGSNELFCYIIAFVVAALICYIVWLKRFEGKSKNS